LIKPRDELAELPGVDAPRSLNNESLLDSSGSRSLLLISIVGRSSSRIVEKVR
jgi:hypothetical protein